MKAPAFLAALLILFALISAGCGGTAAQPDGETGEKLAYVYRSGDTGNLMLTTTAGGVGENLLQWQGHGERFSFTNDGRFFTIALWKVEPAAGQLISRHRFFIAATDGSSAWHIPGNVDLLTFSPDSTRVAYITMPDNGPNEVRVMDIVSGVAKTLASGTGLLNPVWVDDHTLVYTELNTTPFASRSEGGIIYKVDTASGESTRLTSGERLFSTYGPPVSYARKDLVLTERGELSNLWSLDLGSGKLKQITNNTQFHFRASYLGLSNRILFEQQKYRDDRMSSELCVMPDDGSDFKMLTTNFFFDGLNSYSLESGRIAFQRTKDSGVTSIWTIDADGSGASMVTEAETGWLGDPNFAPVSGWKGDNPLSMEVAGSNAGEPLTVRISNASGESVDAVLRAFPGMELMLPDVAGGGEVEAAGGVHGAPAAVWRLKLEPGETREISLLPALLPTVAIPTETALLVTLAVEGAPPRMYWQQFE
ncbi:MAG: hypothetical protein HZB44_10665 [Actinobacteria bacterium]|nr:hypothetical protein [Actinomycetota bacterium]